MCYSDLWNCAFVRYPTKSGNLLTSQRFILHTQSLLRIWGKVTQCNTTKWVTKNCHARHTQHCEKYVFDVINQLECYTSAHTPAPRRQPAVTNQDSNCSTQLTNFLIHRKEQQFIHPFHRQDIHPDSSMSLTFGCVTFVFETWRWEMNHGCVEELLLEFLPSFDTTRSCTFWTWDLSLLGNVFFFLFRRVLSYLLHFIVLNHVNFRYGWTLSGKGSNNKSRGLNEVDSFRESEASVLKSCFT